MELADLLAGGLVPKRLKEYFKIKNPLFSNNNQSNIYNFLYLKSTFEIHGKNNCALTKHRQY